MYEESLPQKISKIASMTQNSGKAPCKSEVKLDYITKAASLV